MAKKKSSKVKDLIRCAENVFYARLKAFPDRLICREYLDENSDN